MLSMYGSQPENQPQIRWE